MRTLTPPTDPAVLGARSRRRRALALFAAVNALAAWSGTIGLVGGGLSFGDELDARLPFGSLQLAGLALAGIVAIPLSALAWLAWTDHPRADQAASLCGGLLVGWIVVQLGFLRAFSWFHPTYLAIGIALLVVGGRRRVSQGSAPGGSGLRR